MGRFVHLAAAAVFLLLPAGCGSRRDLSAENHRLRGQVLDLTDELEAMQDRVRELEAELRAAAGAAEDVLPEDVRAAIPRMVEISIGRRSHVRDEDGDGRADALRLYVRPTDGRGRFLQIVGRLSIHVARLPAEADAVTIGRLSLGPQALREAYRSSFTGTHYTVIVPIDPAAPEKSGGSEPECVVRIVFEDALTGLRHTAERAIGLDPPASASASGG